MPRILIFFPQNPDKNISGNKTTVLKKNLDFAPMARGRLTKQTQNVGIAFVIKVFFP